MKFDNRSYLELSNVTHENDGIFIWTSIFAPIAITVYGNILHLECKLV